MKLEVGKKYKNRRGEELEIIRHYDNGLGFPFVGDDECTYTEEGLYNLDAVSPYDLVEEILE